LVLAKLQTRNFPILLDLRVFFCYLLAENKIKNAFQQPNSNSNQGMFVPIEPMTIEALGLRDATGNGLINVFQASGEDISQLIDILDDALLYVTRERAKMGAKQNHLEYTARSLAISSENLQDSESRIRNADMAREMMALTKQQMLQQAGVSMLAQANQRVEGLVGLLR